MKIKEQIKKGCGRHIFDSGSRGGDSLYYLCGNRRKELCSTCIEKIKAIESYEKEILEIINNFSIELGRLYNRNCDIHEMWNAISYCLDKIEKEIKGEK